MGGVGGLCSRERGMRGSGEGESLLKERLKQGYAVELSDLLLAFFDVGLASGAVGEMLAKGPLFGGCGLACVKAVQMVRRGARGVVFVCHESLA